MRDDHNSRTSIDERSSSRNDRNNVSHRRRRSNGTSGKVITLLIKLLAAAIGSCIGKPSGTSPILVMAFQTSPPRMASNSPNVNSRTILNQLDATCSGTVCELPTKEPTASTRVTKKALLESIGYGVMDPVAYRTFENSPLLPKLRPTTHIRIAEGVHSFMQEFLGVPPEDSRDEPPFVPPGESYAEAAAVASSASAAYAGGRSPRFELHAKLPGIGVRMTVLRLGNGELLLHSPVAPTVELLDMLRDSFPAIGPTSKVHLFSTSLSPEHWAFLKHWKEVFPSAEVWAVPGPHRRLMGVEVNHDIEHIRGLPERLGGEVEVAVLEGVPAVREALLLHRPTGTMLSADLLLAMHQNTPGDHPVSDEEGRRPGAVRHPDTALSSTPSSPQSSAESQLQEPVRFGDHSNRRVKAQTDLDPVEGSMWKRVRWGLLGTTTSLLGMNTLAVLAPVKALMIAFKGNSAALSSRVLGWDTKVFVGSHGQSPLEGPDVKSKLYAALGRYAEAPPEAKPDKKKMGTRLLTLIPGRRGDQSNNGPPDVSQGIGPPGVSSPTDNHTRGGGGSGNEAGGPFVPELARTVPVGRSTVSPGETMADTTNESKTVGETNTREVVVSTAPPLSPPANVPHGGDSLREGEPALRDLVAVDRAPGDEDWSLNLTNTLSGWDRRGTEPPSVTGEKTVENEKKEPPKQQRQGGGQRTVTYQQPAAKPAASHAPGSATQRAGGNGILDGKMNPEFETKTAIPAEEAGTASTSVTDAVMSEVEKRARQYMKEKAESTKRSKAADSRASVEDVKLRIKSPKKSPPASPTTRNTLGGRRESSMLDSEMSVTLQNESVVEGAPEGSGNPFVVEPDSRYDERATGLVEEGSQGEDPFEMPFYPFNDDAPFINDGPLQ